MKDPTLSPVRLPANPWGFVDAIDPGATAVLDTLEQNMAQFYNGRALQHDYWEGPEKVNAIWRDESHHCHVDLASRISEGAVVADFGRGSAEAYSNLSSSRITYLGFDVSSDMIARNKERFPSGRFYAVNPTMEWHEMGLAQVDWAISLFALEHVVRPQCFLKMMVSSLKPGGKRASSAQIFGLSMNSIRMGRTALVKRDKLRQGRIFDLLLHLIQEKWLWPARLASIQKSPMRFPIYTTPRCLEAPYFSDNDAVYLVSQDKLCRELRAMGLSIETPVGHALGSSETKVITYIVGKRALHSS